MSDMPPDITLAAERATYFTGGPKVLRRAVAQAILDERRRFEAIVADPNAVHINMLRGTIAKPSLAQILHIYGKEAVLEALST